MRNFINLGFALAFAGIFFLFGAVICLTVRVNALEKAQQKIVAKIPAGD